LIYGGIKMENISGVCTKYPGLSAIEKIPTLSILQIIFRK